MERKTVVAVDIGATHYRAGLVADDGSIVRLEVGDTPRVGESGLAVTRAVGDAVEAVVGPASPAAIGIASAGPLDCAAGLIVCSPNMAFPEVPLRGPLERRFGLPVLLLNDCRAGALGERWQGAGQGVENLVYVTLSTGIGGGAVVNGRLLLGRSGNAGEVGHFFVDGGYGCVCGCGHPGHWEAYASGTGMPRFFAAWLEGQGAAPSFDAATSVGILGAAERGDPLALSFMDALGRVNARALSDIVAAYEPEVVVLDGPLAQHHGDLLIRSFLPHLDRYLPLPDFAVSHLGGRAPLLGAAAYVLGIF
ncbi:ROK family protein [uncultured Methanofollis sp.]|uniref:ROK family protein n=1 Tax=uncultured Methanofollis sp. TaxID=262500 RepID=UPI00261A9595|nr:ROK family protein [uncultured Methanofollis sp.]